MAENQRARRRGARLGRHKANLIACYAVLAYNMNTYDPRLRQEYDTGQCKFSAHLELREAKDRETLRELVRDADLFSQGYRPGTLGALGFSPEALAILRPGIVFVSLCAFGHFGPWAS